MTKERRNITVDPTIWQQGIKKAAEVGRSVSGYIEQLIREDTKEKKGKTKG